MNIYFTETAQEHFDNLSQLYRRRISTKMRFFSAQSDPLKFAEPLTGSKKEYRFRIGDYRVIFEVINDTLWVTAIKRRDEAYK